MKNYRKRKELSEEILKHLYLVKEYSISMIEKELDVSRGNIEYYFKKYNIPKKTQSEIQKSPIIRKKIEETCITKYGFKAAFADEKKRKQTKKEKYGDEKYNNSKKQKETCIKKFGVTSYLATNECKTILLKKYDVSTNIFQSNEIKQKSKKTKKERYGDENFNNQKKYKQTCLKHFGVDNPSKSDEIKNKKIQTSLKNYGVEYPWQTRLIKEKVENIMITKYGVKNAFLLDICIKRSKEKMLELYNCEYGFQSNIIQNKIFRNSFKIKEYKFKSGRITYVLGYENIMLDILIKSEINENDILTNLDCPKIKWKDENEKEHYHIPDIFLKSQNKIIEVKSEWTSQEKYLKNILLKQKYAKEAGYFYEIKVIDKKTKSIKYEIN
jgi:hypothetical protein